MRTDFRLNPDEIFVRRIQNDLIHQTVAGWRRRGRTLLLINCADGRFLRPLWHSGFDVTATEPNSALRGKAANSMGAHADIYAAADTDLPFDEDSFDWAVLQLRTDPEELKTTIAEATRVVRRGLAVTFWNSCSPAFFANRKTQHDLSAFNFWSVYAALRSQNAGTISTRSTLLFAFPKLRRLCPRLYFSSAKTRLPIGAWTIVKLDLSAQSSVTPLALRTGLRKINQLEPLLEYAKVDPLPTIKEEVNYPTRFRDGACVNHRLD